jgi:hypothetical protein
MSRLIIAFAFLSVVLYSFFTGALPARAVPPNAGESETILLQQNQLITLNPSAMVPLSAGHEISGIVKSRKHPDLYWIINDSDNPPCLIPINEKGSILSPVPSGIIIQGARNIDWEDLAIDPDGVIYIFDTGNNWSMRQDLCVYAVRESADAALLAPGAERIRIRYPEQKVFAPIQLVYDCEAGFVFNNKLYLLTKRLSDGFTSLYRMDRKDPRKINELTFLESFPVNGYVTAADMSPDQQKLAVLTYEALWVFSNFKGDSFFKGTTTKIMLNKGGQIESVCFTDNNTLLILSENENRIFTVPLAPYGL